MDVLQSGAEVSGVLAAAGGHTRRRPGGVALRVPAGGRVAAGGTQALGLTVGKVFMAWHSEGGPGANVQVVVLQGVPTMVVVLTGGGDFDPRAYGQACRPGTVQIVSGLLVLISCENLSVVFTVGGAAGLDAVRGGLLQRESLLGLGAEDFVRCKVWIICREERDEKSSENTRVATSADVSRTAVYLITQVNVHVTPPARFLTLKLILHFFYS